MTIPKKMMMAAAGRSRGNPNAGNLYAWGEGSTGEIGDGLKTDVSSPVQVGSLVEWAVMSTGQNHSIGIRTDGTMWGWGLNTTGELGIGSTTSPMVAPIQIGTDTDWASCDAGAVTGHAIKTGGTLWSWGSNASGRLGDGTVTNRNAPVQIGALTTWSKISSGGGWTLGLRTDGKIFSWGDAALGRTGQNTTTDVSSPVQIGSSSTWTDIAAGNQHGYGIDAGQWWSWGANSVGQLGHGNTTANSNPIQVGALTTWTNVVCGTSFGYALKNDTTIWGSGINGSGELGDGSTAHKSSPVQVGGTGYTVPTSMAYNCSTGMSVRTDGTLWAWGYNASGLLLQGNTTTTSSPVQVGALTDWATSHMGPAVVHMINTDGHIYGGGTGAANGRVGNGTISVSYLSPVQVGNHSPWEYVAVGSQQVLGITEDYTLWAWGDNSTQGPLGDLTTVDKSFPVQVKGGPAVTAWRSIAMGSYVSAGVDSAGKLWTWGSGGSGRSGHGDTANRSSPVQVGSLTDWSLPALGTDHAGSIKTDGTLWMWGDNGNGELGDGSSTDRSSPVQIGSLTTWARVECGNIQTIAVTTAGTLFTWGLNTSGALGDGSTTARSSPVQVGSLTTWASDRGSIAMGNNCGFAIKTDGTLWSWGANGSGQQGHGNTTALSSPVQVGSLTNWKTVSTLAGQDSVMFTKTDRTLWFCGNGAEGQNGKGTTTTYSSPVQVGSETDWVWGYYHSSNAGGIRNND